MGVPSRKGRVPIYLERSEDILHSRLRRARLLSRTPSLYQFGPPLRRSVHSKKTCKRLNIADVEYQVVTIQWRFMESDIFHICPNFVKGRISNKQHFE
ncbi:hypothetical protein NPIL_529181 [Nephila pilipes]|uniref:Uncharacterized protein n=1 Tax=Nephila pilipes TaxID=299642 RepID=A0A8X6ICT5_NEPPI|nr:hypothetical protein NPIL_529181 [Nephila pilipes]